MKSQNRNYLIGLLAVMAMLIIILIPAGAKAHCDTMDGPVIKDAQEALETGNVNLVLIWVQKGDENELKTAFNKALAVRKLDPDAKELADQYFFETLVRIHRAGEGAPYTGVKPAGTIIDPALEAADKSIENGSIAELIDHLNKAVSEGIHDRYADLQAKQNYNPDNIEAGREYVEAYVKFIHYVEQLFNDANPEKSEHAH